MSYPTHPTSFRLRSTSKLWGYSAITVFDKYCYKSGKYRLLLSKLLPQLLSVFGLIPVKFKTFFYSFVELYIIVFKVKRGGWDRVKKKLITRIRGYKPFRYKWLSFFGKNTPFFYSAEFFSEDDPSVFFNKEFVDVKNQYFLQSFKNYLTKFRKAGANLFLLPKIFSKAENFSRSSSNVTGLSLKNNFLAKSRKFSSPILQWRFFLLDFSNKIFIKKFTENMPSGIASSSQWHTASFLSPFLVNPAAAVFVFWLKLINFFKKAFLFPNCFTYPQQFVLPAFLATDPKLKSTALIFKQLQKNKKFFAALRARKKLYCRRVAAKRKKKIRKVKKIKFFIRKHSLLFTSDVGCQRQQSGFLRLAAARRIFKQKNLQQFFINKNVVSTSLTRAKLHLFSSVLRKYRPGLIKKKKNVFFVKGSFVFSRKQPANCRRHRKILSRRHPTTLLNTASLLIRRRLRDFSWVLALKKRLFYSQKKLLLRRFSGGFLLLKNKRIKKFYVKEKHFAKNKKQKPNFTKKKTKFSKSDHKLFINFTKADRHAIIFSKKLRAAYRFTKFPTTKKNAKSVSRKLLALFFKKPNFYKQKTNKNSTAARLTTRPNRLHYKFKRLKADVSFGNGLQRFVSRTAPNKNTIPANFFEVSASRDAGGRFFYNKKLKYLQYFYFFDASFRGLVFSKASQLNNMFLPAVSSGAVKKSREISCFADAGNAGGSQQNSLGSYPLHHSTTNTSGENSQPDQSAVSSSFYKNAPFTPAAFVIFYLNLLFTSKQIVDQKKLLSSASAIGAFFRFKRWHLHKKKRCFAARNKAFRQKQKTLSKKYFLYKSKKSKKTRRRYRSSPAAAANRGLGGGFNNRQRTKANNPFLAKSKINRQLFFNSTPPLKKNLRLRRFFLNGKAVFAKRRLVRSFYSKNTAIWHKNVFLKKTAQVFYHINKSMNQHFLKKNSRTAHQPYFRNMAGRKSTASMLPFTTNTLNKNVAKKAGGVAPELPGINTRRSIGKSKFFWYAYLAKLARKKIASEKASVFLPLTITSRKSYKAKQKRRAVWHARILFRKFYTLKNKTQKNARAVKLFTRKRKLLHCRLWRTLRSKNKPNRKVKKRRLAPSGGGQKKRMPRKKLLRRKKFFNKAGVISVPTKVRHRLFWFLKKKKSRNPRGKLFARKTKIKKNLFLRKILSRINKKKQFYCGGVSAVKQNFLRAACTYRQQQTSSNKLLTNKAVPRFGRVARRKEGFGQNNSFAPRGYIKPTKNLFLFLKKRSLFSTTGKYVRNSGKIRNFLAKKNLLLRILLLRQYRRVGRLQHKFQKAFFSPISLTKHKTVFCFNKKLRVKKIHKPGKHIRKKKKFKVSFSKKKKAKTVAKKQWVLSSQPSPTSNNHKLQTSTTAWTNSRGAVDFSKKIKDSFTAVPASSAAQKSYSPAPSRLTEKHNISKVQEIPAKKHYRKPPQTAAQEQTSAPLRRAKTKEASLLEIEAWSRAGGPQLVVKKQDPDFYKSLRDSENSKQTQQKFLKLVAPMLAAQDKTASNHALGKKYTQNKNKQQAQAPITGSSVDCQPNSKTKGQQYFDKRRAYFNAQININNKNASFSPKQQQKTSAKKVNDNSLFAKELTRLFAIRNKFRRRKKLRGRRNWKRRRTRRYLHILRTRKRKNVYSRMLLAPFGYFRPIFIKKKLVARWFIKSKKINAPKKKRVISFSEFKKTLQIVQKRIFNRRRRNQFILTWFKKEFARKGKLVLAAAARKKKKTRNYYLRKNRAGINRLRKKLAFLAPNKTKIFFLPKAKITSKKKLRQYYAALSFRERLVARNMRFKALLLKPDAGKLSNFNKSAFTLVTAKFNKKKTFALGKRKFFNLTGQSPVKKFKSVGGRKFMLKPILKLKKSAFFKPAPWFTKWSRRTKKTNNLYLRQDPQRAVLAGTPAMRLFSNKKIKFLRFQKRIFPPSGFFLISSSKLSEKLKNFKAAGITNFLVKKAQKRLFFRKFYKKVKQLFFFYSNLPEFKNKNLQKKKVAGHRRRLQHRVRGLVSKSRVRKNILWMLKNKSSLFSNKLPRGLNFLIFKKQAEKKKTRVPIFLTHKKFFSKTKKAYYKQFFFSALQRLKFLAAAKKKKSGRAHKFRRSVYPANVVLSLVNRLVVINKKKARQAISSALANSSSSKQRFLYLTKTKKNSTVKFKNKQKKKRDKLKVTTGGVAPRKLRKRKAVFFVKSAKKQRRAQVVFHQKEIASTIAAFRQLRKRNNFYFKVGYRRGRAGHKKRLQLRGFKLFNKFKANYRNLWFRTDVLQNFFEAKQVFSSIPVINLKLLNHFNRINIAFNSSATFTFLKMAKKIRLRRQDRFTKKPFLNQQRAGWVRGGRASGVKKDNTVNINFRKQNNAPGTAIARRKKNRKLFFKKYVFSKQRRLYLKNRRLRITKFYTGLNAPVRTKFYRYAERYFRISKQKNFVVQRRFLLKVQSAYKKTVTSNFYARSQNRLNSQKAKFSIQTAITNFLLASRRKPTSFRRSIFAYKTKQKSFWNLFDAHKPSFVLHFYKTPARFLGSNAWNFFSEYTKIKIKRELLCRSALLFFLYRMVVLQKELKAELFYNTVATGKFDYEQYPSNSSSNSYLSYFQILVRDFAIFLFVFQFYSEGVNVTARELIIHGNRNHDSEQKKATNNYFLNNNPLFHSSGYNSCSTTASTTGLVKKASLFSMPTPITRVSYPIFFDIAKLRSIFFTGASHSSLPGTIDLQHNFVTNSLNNIGPYLLFNSKNAFRANINNFSYPKRPRLLRRVVKFWNFRYRYLNLVRYPGVVLKKKLLKAIGPKILSRLIIKYARRKKYFLRLLKTRTHYIKKSFEFIFSEILFRLFFLKVKISFTNVLQVLTRTGIKQRKRLFQKFLLTLYTPKKIGLRLKIFYFNFFNLYFYSIYFKNLILFLNFLSKHFKTINDQRRMVKLSRNLISRCAILKINRNLVGLKFIISGKLNKRPRSRTTAFLYRRASGTQALDMKIYYAAKQLFNKFGAFGTKVWMYSF